MLNTILLPTVNVLAIIITITTLSARKATIDHLVNSTSLEKRLKSPVSGFCYAGNRVC